MANKHMKIFSASFVIREMHIKIKMRCHYISIRKAKIKNYDMQMLARMWKNWNPHTLLV